jgi:hypothetical protein
MKFNADKNVCGCFICVYLVFLVVGIERMFFGMSLSAFVLKIAGMRTVDRNLSD